jgi:hypothetical protein
MVYETDTDMLALWNGSAWRYIAATTPTNGTVLQVVTATTSTLVANSTSTYTSTGLSASITPKSTSSKILVIVSQSMYNYAAGGGFSAMNVRLMRQQVVSTILQTVMDAGFARAYVSPTGVDTVHQFSINFLDSPSTTSAVSYRTDLALSYGNSVYAQVNNNPSSITLMEIAG